MPHAPQLLGSFVVSTHALEQSVRPLPHDVVHVPVEHTCIDAHLFPQEPQLLGSPCVLVHTPPQRWPLLKHTHWPIWQVVPPLQTMPQAPQLALSVCSSTQAAPHCVCPVVQLEVHLPLAQSWPGPQAVLHAPQLFVSVCVFVQVPLQSVCPPGQRHWLIVQLALVGHALPHDPQLALSVLVSTQPPLHCVRPAPQLDPH